MADDATTDVTAARVAGHAMSGILCGLLVITLVANAAAMLFIAPRFTTIFEDFDTSLPGLTLFIIEWRLMLAGLCILLAGMAVVKEVLIRHPYVKLVTNIAVLAGSVVLVPLTIVALFLPLVALMRSVM